MSDKPTLRTGSSGDEVTSLHDLLLQFSFNQVGAADKASGFGGAVL
jgi:hypothetical protein